MNEIIAASKKEVRYLRKGRRRVYQYTLMKEKWQSRAVNSVVRKYNKPKPFKKPIFIEFTWYEANRRRDPDNIVAGKKFILDALVKVGAIKNDNMTWILGFEDKFVVSKEVPPGVYVKVYEGR
jgi:Holliday junction resolvase RusA-like endonuclease